MKLAVSLRTSYPREWGATAPWIVERAAAAARAGLDGLFVGDHHSTGPSEAYHQGLPLLARLTAAWGDAPVGALVLLPLWHPVLLAEQIGTVAALARGRFVLQVAIGSAGAQFRAMGVAEQGRTHRFEADLEVVRRLLTGERVSDDRGSHAVVDACIAPVPRDPVEIWIGATAPAAIDRAARLGDGWICNAHVVPGEALEQVELFRERVAAHGRRPTAVAIRRDVHVASDDRRAATQLERVVAGGYRGFRPEALTAGTVESVAEQLGAYAAMGYTHVVVRQLADDQAAAVESIELLGEVRALLADA